MRALKIYKQLSSENKASFWSILVSTIVGVVSCFLGFSIQYLVADKYQQDAEVLAHHKIVDKYLPIYNNFIDSCYYGVVDSLGYEYLHYYSPPSYSFKERVEKILGMSENKQKQKDSTFLAECKYLENHENRKLVRKVAYNSAEQLGSIRFYLNEKESKEVDYNNKCIIMGCIAMDVFGCDSAITEYIEGKMDFKRQLTSASTIKISGFFSNIDTLQSKLLNLIVLNDVAHFCGEDSIIQEAEKTAVLDFFVKPMFDNLRILEAQFKEKRNSQTEAAMIVVTIFVVCIIVGWVIFIFVLNKAFPQPSLNCKSQDEVNKLIKCNDDLRNDIKAKEEEINTLKGLNKALVEKQNDTTDEGHCYNAVMEKEQNRFIKG